MKLIVKHQSPMSFLARAARPPRELAPGEAQGSQAERFAELRLDGSVDLGGDDAYLRPMEGVLASLASCSGVDVVMILKQQRQSMDGLEILLEAERADAVPAVFTAIHMVFQLKGEIAANKALRAVSLSVDKYCSVVRMLSPGVKITYGVELNGAQLQKE